MNKSKPGNCWNAGLPIDQGMLARSSRGDGAQSSSEGRGKVGAFSRRLLCELTLILPVVALISLFTAMPLRAATNDLTTLLQRGLFEEEANRNLDAAITNYESLAKQFDKDRQIAATAIFRLGECYRKLGRTNEAVLQYERIVRDFSDQQSLVTLSRQDLTGMGVASEPKPATATTTGWSQAAEAAEAEAASLKAQLDQLQSLKRDQLRAVVQQNHGNPVLTKLFENLAEAEQKLVGLRTIYESQHPVYTHQLVVMQTINRQIDEQIDGVVLGLVIKQSAAEERAKALRAKAGESKSSALVKPAESSVTDDEEKDIRRIQAMIQNSPDLINGVDSSGLTPLSSAVFSGYLQAARYLLDHGADPNLALNGITPLHYATMKGNKAIVELLLSRGAAVNAPDTNGRTALNLAAKAGFLSVCELLISNHADLEPADKFGNTPVEAAAEAGKMEVLKLLIAKGANINPPDGGPMTKAAIQGQNAIVKFLLASGASVNSVDKNGRSALSHATEKRNLNLVMTLLEAKADPNAGTLNLPLSWAIKQGDTNLVGVLLRAGADPNKTADSVRPLELAVGGMQPAIVQLLLQFKADPNVSFGTGTLPIFRGLFDLEILKALLAAGANPNSIETNSSGGIGAQGETPLQVAARIRFERSADGQRYTLNNRGDFDAARLLIAHGAKVNVQRPSDGMTPLHLAVRAVNRELVELLLTNKAEVNVRSSAGSTPLDLAKSQATQTSLDTSSRATSAEIVALLRRHGALDALPDFSKIRVTRQSLNQPITVFEQNTNGGNRYTVLEALLDLYLKAHDSSVLNGPVTVSKTWAFPDLTRLIIYRRARTGADKEQLIPLNLLNPTNGIICGRDVILEFGDILEIPTREYTLGEPSIGLTSEQENAIADCLERSVTLKVRGQTRELQLKPHIVKFTGSLFCFYLQSALNTPEAQSLLLSSSDLARVKVIRKDAENGRTVEFIVNAALNSSDLLFWLRDGDVIEVPEK